MKTNTQREGRYFRLLLGAQIRALRLYRGWSQARLGRAAKMTQGAIARIENGQTNMTASTIERVITAWRGRLRLEIATEPPDTRKD